MRVLSVCNRLSAQFFYELVHSAFRWPIWPDQGRNFSPCVEASGAVNMSPCPVNKFTVPDGSRNRQNVGVSPEVSQIVAGRQVDQGGVKHAVREEGMLTVNRLRRMIQAVAAKSVTGIANPSETKGVRTAPLMRGFSMVGRCGSRSRLPLAFGAVLQARFAWPPDCKRVPGFTRTKGSPL